MHQGIDPATRSDIVWHETLGIAVLVLTLIRLLLLALGSEGHPLTLLGGVRVDRLPLIAESALGKLADWGDVHQIPRRRHSVAGRFTCSSSVPPIRDQGPSSPCNAASQANTLIATQLRRKSRVNGNSLLPATLMVAGGTCITPGV